MWDVHLGPFKREQRRKELSPEDKRPVQSSPYPAGPKAFEFLKNEITRMFELVVIALAQPEWAISIVFAPKNEGMLRVSVDHKTLIAVTVRASYPFPLWTDKSTHWEMQRYSRHWTQTAVTGK